MNQRISKQESRKAMSVATVFTGVTAIAAAFPSAANAQCDGSHET
jgi:alkylhydroperoxidase/carboxymuconolactone decarboxylase family protein YurZ